MYVHGAVSLGQSLLEGRAGGPGAVGQPTGAGAGAGARIIKIILFKLNIKIENLLYF